jgi:hypothetical protein
MESELRIGPHHSNVGIARDSEVGFHRNMANMIISTNQVRSKPVVHKSKELSWNKVGGQE